MAMKNKGFTLIELMVVVILAAILVVTAVSLFFTVITGNEKTAAALSVKQNGDYAISQMSRLIRNSRSATCSSNPSALTLVGNDGGTTILSAVQYNPVTYQIASNSGFLTDSSVSVASSGLITLTCVNLTDGTPSYVTVSFTLEKGAVGDRDYVSVPFSTSVGLRTY